MSLENFKSMLGVETIDLLKGKGRAFAKVGTTQVFASKDLDTSKQMYVVLGKYDAYWLCNSSNVKTIQIWRRAREIWLFTLVFCLTKS